MKITKSQLKSFIKEEKLRLNETSDAFGRVMEKAIDILGQDIELDEEMDGNILIIADEDEIEYQLNQLMMAFPTGEMVEDGFATGVFQESNMRITKSQLSKIIKEEKAALISEMNPDGTISDDEDEMRHDFLAEVEMQIDELIEFILASSRRIGGDFRGPGIRAAAKKTMLEKIQMMGRRQ